MAIDLWLGRLLMQAVAKRTNANTIQISDEAMAALDRLIGESGVPKKVAVEKMIFWLLDAGDIVAGTVLKTIPRSIMVDAARWQLERVIQKGHDYSDGKTADGRPLVAEREAPKLKRRERDTAAK